MAQPSITVRGETLHPGRVLVVAAALHACNDAFFYVLYPVLPLIATDLHLSYAQVGLVNAAFAGSGAVLQWPAGVFGERWGEYTLLAWGNGWVAIGLMALALAGSFPQLLAAAVVGGFGGNVQHPLAASLVARAYERGKRGVAIGTLNFAGDLGKLAAPAMVALTAVTFGWRATLAGLGVAGVLFSLGVGCARAWVQPPSSPRPVEGEGATSVGAGLRLRLPTAFAWLALVGMLDATTRTAALTFLPFQLQVRGLGTGDVGVLFGLLFAGGAAGKFLAGTLNDRWGGFAVIATTEVLTAASLLGLVWAPLGLSAGLALVFGAGLNGTSSVLYAAVASLVPDGQRGSGYGVYYTATQLAAAAAAFAYGLLAERLGLPGTFAVMAVITLAVVPLAVPLSHRLHGG